MANELQQRIATENIVEPEQSNATTTLSEAEKSNASANSKESGANNDITTLMIKHESVNCSYPQLPRQLHDNMLDHQDDACLGDYTSSMVIPSDNGAARMSLLMEMIEKSEEIDGCMLEDFKRDDPSLGLHRILVEDCYSNWWEQQLPQQRRLHPTKMEVDKNKVIKRNRSKVEGIHGLQRNTKERRLHGNTKGSNGEHIGPTLHGKYCHPMEVSLASVGVLSECTSKQLDEVRNNLQKFFKPTPDHLDGTPQATFAPAPAKTLKTTTSATASSLPPPKSSPSRSRQKKYGNVVAYWDDEAIREYMPWQCCPQQEPSNFMDPELARLNALMRESTVAMNNLLHADMSCKYSPQQELSNSNDDELARLEALVREATHDMNSMRQQSTHWDTEVLMQEVQKQWEETSPMCETQLEPLKQDHVDEKECPNELQHRIAMKNIGEPEQRNATTIPNEAEKSNASTNSKEPDVENVTTMLMLNHESVNCSYPQLPWQFHDSMLSQQDDDTLQREYDEPSKGECDFWGDNTSSMVIPSDNGAARKSLLMEMIEMSKEISGCMLEDFRKDVPSLDLHRILANDCHDNWLELPRQRRLHPTMMEGDENEEIKWLGVDITFPLNKFMPSRILARWRVFMDHKGKRKKYTSMVTQKGAMVSTLAQLFMGNIVTRWRSDPEASPIPLRKRTRRNTASSTSPPPLDMRQKKYGNVVAYWDDEAIRECRGIFTRPRNDKREKIFSPHCQPAMHVVDLSFAEELEYHHVILESDSRTLVQKLKISGDDYLKIRPAAHAVTVVGKHRLTDTAWYGDAPLEVLSIVEADQRNITAS
ncbi:hypothetical protein GQ457_01G000050 [Hibiscus cannabinus]